MSREGSRPESSAPQEDLRALRDATGASGPRRGRFVAGAFVAALDLILFAVLFWPYAAPPTSKPSHPSTLVSFVALPEPPGRAGAPNAEASAPPIFVPPPLPRLTPPVVSIASTPASDTSDLLSESQLAGATSAGEGGAGGGGCDTARAVQQVLRRDPLVHAAVEDAHRLGKAILLWNGDWVQSGGQDGKGLSAVREAIIWEVAFAPEACRNARLHGLVVLSLADGSTRFAIGAGEWRWSDLLGMHPSDR